MLPITENHPIVLIEFTLSLFAEEKYRERSGTRVRSDNRINIINNSLS